MKALKLHVTGVVQGVGFRPYVYKLAGELSLQGWVLNASDGVHICVEGSDALADSFPQILEAGAAKEVPAASIESVSIRSVPVSNFSNFEIRPSVVDVNERTFISPDVASCPSCTEELYSQDDRRYRYPFTNCTDCGPRFTIIEDTPYDRPKTTMQAFTLCAQCKAEYNDPTNRRFHAQPNACFACGPRLYFNRPSSDGSDNNSPTDKAHDHWEWSPDEELIQLANTPKDVESERARSNSILLEASEVLTQGQILALKGLGGFQLACNAQSEMAVSRLRDRKARWGKPLAVMFANIEQAARYVHIDAAERVVLEGSVRPIVLCKRRDVPLGAPELALSVAPDLREIGVMLPYTPLHHLLLEEFYGPVIMTSGNISGAPIVCDNSSALEQLARIADAFLLHDRPIAGRYDDSVVRIIDGRTQMVRRARGYAPMPIRLAGGTSHSTGTESRLGTLPEAGSNLAANASSKKVPAILAVGPEQKNTFTLIDTASTHEDTYAFTSQHIGDLENSETLTAFEETIAQYRRLFKISPQVIAHDLHPEYLSTKWAKVQEEQTAGSNKPLRLIGVQHHHAHVVAAAAEHGVNEPVIGIAFDGTGYGSDGSIWGGEILITGASHPSFERFAHLRPFALPGGAGAIKRPIRTLYALLDDYKLREHPAVASIERRLEEHEGATVLAMAEKGLNTPMTTSMGRLFDAVAALLGICDDASFEGSPAMMLEAVSSALDAKPTPPRYRFAMRPAPISESATAGVDVIIDPEPVIRALLDDMEAMEDPESELTTAELARRFHDAVVTMIGDISTKAARQRDLDTVALAGGVFMNRLVMSGARSILENKGLRVIAPEQLPVNDGSISFGQSVIARNILAIEEM
ncbi:MAG: carbamoyltransferase HypF [Coriobacteriia bacterium]|nr:carbamoyltransferase HypF [Coriobacteriia bacterium]